MKCNTLANITPGEILEEDFLKPMCLSQFWLNLQSHYELELAEDRLGQRLEREVKVMAPG